MAVSRRKKMLREQKLKAFSSELKREKKFTSSNVNLREFKDYVPSRSYVRSTQAYKSHEGFTNQATTTARQQRHEYSGEYITGLATMHKSNIVPVGRGDDPKNYSTMRRN